MLAFDDLAEAADRFLERNVAAFDAGELLGDGERLGQEALDLAGAADGQLVLFGELVHTHDRDDVLKLLVALKDALDLSGDLVVFDADDVRSENSGGRVERVDGGIDAEGRDASRKNRRCVKVGKRGCRRGVGEVVGGNVNGLDRRDRTLFGRGDAFLKSAHFGGESRLVADGGGHSAEKG